MAEITIPIVYVTEEECLAKIDDIFKDTDLSEFLEMALKADYDIGGVKNVVQSLFPSFAKLDQLEQSYFSLYLEQHYTVRFEWIEYKGIVPIGEGGVCKK